MLKKPLSLLSIENGKTYTLLEWNLRLENKIQKPFGFMNYIMINNHEIDLLIQTAQCTAFCNIISTNISLSQKMKKNF